jgi:Transposase, Mutator family
LVVIGARPDGTKELVAIEDGYRESTESWATLLRDLKARGMQAPTVAVGDGALGFWAALRQVWPKTKDQRCWFHKMGNVLDKLRKRQHPQAKRSLHEMMYADSRKNFDKELARFAAEYQAKYPKAVEARESSKDPPILDNDRRPPFQIRSSRLSCSLESCSAHRRISTLIGSSVVFGRGLIVGAQEGHVVSKGGELRR